jgi:hypothetical protein
MLLLYNQADLDAGLRAHDHEGNTPLHVASTGEVVDYLVATGTTRIIRLVFLICVPNFPSLFSIAFSTAWRSLMI